MHLLLGTITDTQEPTLFAPDDDVLAKHLAIFGGTRYGKSKLIEQIGRELILAGQGFAFIDPHSDTADDLFAYIAHYYDRLGVDATEIHYLNLDDCAFAYDPFEYVPDPDDPLSQTEFGYQCWLDCKIKDMVRIICRKQGDTEEEAQKMVRLRRWLYNVLYAVGVRQADGSHLSLTDAIPLLTPTHPQHATLYQRVEPHLSDEVRTDFEKLRQTKDPRRQEDWIESTVNRLRDVLSPLTKVMFSAHAQGVINYAGQPVKPIRFHQIIANNGKIIASLGKTSRFHEEEAQVLAALIIREISDAVATTRRSNRKQFYLFIDEAQNFLGEDLIRLFKESAKYRLSIGVAVQQLDNLQRGEIDLVPTVLGNCGVRITFRQKYQEHAELLAKSLCFNLLDFTELIHTIERDDGYQWVTVVSASMGKSTSDSVQRTQGQSRTRSRSHSDTVSVAESIAQQYGRSLSQSRNWSRAQNTMRGREVSHSWSSSDSQQEQNAVNQSSGRSHDESSGRTHRVGMGSEPPALNNNQRQGATDSHGHSHALTVGFSRQQGGSEGLKFSQGSSSSRGGAVAAALSQGNGRTKTNGRSHGVSWGEAWGEMSSVSIGHTEGESFSLSLSPTPLHQVRLEEQRTGKLQRSISDQLHQFTQTLMTLPKQHCLVSIDADDRTFVMRVADVLDPFVEKGVSDELRQAHVKYIKQRLFTMHPWYFSLATAAALPPTGVSPAMVPLPAMNRPQSFRTP